MEAGTEHGWQAEIRVDGKPATTAKQAKDALVACSMWVPDCNEPELEDDGDNELGLWLVSVPMPFSRILYNQGYLCVAEGTKPRYEIDIETP